MAVAAAMNALGLSGMISGVLPKRWSRAWNKEHFVPFIKWPTQGNISQGDVMKTHLPLDSSTFLLELCL